MKHIFKIYGLLLLVASASCHKQLNVLPTTQEVDGNIIVDKQSAFTALNGIYYRFADAGFDGNNNPSVQWCDQQEILPSELSGLVDYFYESHQYGSHTYTAANTNGVWNYNYDIVNAVNGFIKNILPVTSITGDDKREMIAEALFLRAYANANLLFYHGQYDDISSPYGIVIRKEIVTADNIVQPRSTVKESYDFILADVDSAIAALPYLNSHIYYANVWAARLLKARVLMERASGNDYTQVISLCRDIINDGPFALEDSTKDIFLSAGLNSHEVILGVQPYANDVYKYNEYLFYLDATGTPLMLDLFQHDPRRQWVYKEVFNDDVGGNIALITKYYPGSVTAQAPVAISNISYAMRLTEAYLLEAEAISASGGDINEAKILLKTVMRHAGFTDFSQVDAATGKDLRTLIIKEEMKNFVCEAGQDWLAVRRLPFATVQQLIPSLKNKMLLTLPIPQSEMSRNAALKGMQNPGYGN